MPTVYHPLKGGTKFRISEQYLGHGIAYDFDDVDSGDTVVVSATGGTVVRSVPWDGVSSEGNYVVILGDDGYYYWYLHLESPSPLSVDERVEVGTEVGLMGNTGNSSGKHLHFQATRSLDDYWDQVAVTFYSGDNNGNGELDFGDHDGLNSYLVSDNPGIDGGSESGNSNPSPSATTQQSSQYLISAFTDINGDRAGDELLTRGSDGTIKAYFQYDMPGYIDSSSTRLSDWREFTVGQVQPHLNAELVAIGNIMFDDREELIFEQEGGTSLYVFKQDVHGRSYLYSFLGHKRADETVVGVANLDGSFYPEIVVQRDNSLYAYRMTADNTFESPDPYFVGTIGEGNYRIAGFGDINGDGFQDSVWRNVDNGGIYALLSNDRGESPTKTLITTLQGEFEIVGVEDVLEGGADEILLRKDGGATDSIVALVPDSNGQFHPNGYITLTHFDPSLTFIGQGNTESGEMIAFQTTDGQIELIRVSNSGSHGNYLTLDTLDTGYTAIGNGQPGSGDIGGGSPNYFDPRPVLFNSAVNITFRGFGYEDEVIMQGSDGVIRAFVAGGDGIADSHIVIARPGDDYEWLGGANVFGDRVSSDELIFRKGNALYFSRAYSSGVSRELRLIGTIGPNDEVVGFADLNGVDREEIVIQQGNSFSAFITNSSGIASWKHLFNVGEDQHFVGVGSIDGDNRGELVFVNDAGEIHAYHMRDTLNNPVWHKVGNYGTELQVVGLADLTGDGRDEIVFRDDAGYLGAMYMDHGGVGIDFKWIGFANRENEIIGFGDVNKAFVGEEILYRNPNGNIHTHVTNDQGVTVDFTTVGNGLMELGAFPTQGGSFNPRPVLFDPAFDITHRGRSHQDEVIFRRADGQVTAFLSRMDGVAYEHISVGFANMENELIGGGNIAGSRDSSQEVIFRTPDDQIFMFSLNSNGTARQWSRVGGIGPNDKIVGVQDINGLDREEIILQQGNSFSAFITDSNGVATWKHLFNVGSDQHFVGVGSIDADNRGELLFANAQGEIHAYHMRDTLTRPVWAKVGDFDQFGVGLQIVGPGDLTGDGRDELLFRSDDGQIGAMFMDHGGRAIDFKGIGAVGTEYEILGVGDVNRYSSGEEILFRAPDGGVHALLTDGNGISSGFMQVGWADNNHFSL